jgi:hypothetical protein
MCGRPNCTARDGKDGKRSENERDTECSCDDAATHSVTEAPASPTDLPPSSQPPIQRLRQNTAPRLRQTPRSPPNPSPRPHQPQIPQPLAQLLHAPLHGSSAFTTLPPWDTASSLPYHSLDFSSTRFSIPWPDGLGPSYWSYPQNTVYSSSPGVADVATPVAPSAFCCPKTGIVGKPQYLPPHRTMLIQVKSKRA